MSVGQIDTTSLHLLLKQHLLITRIAGCFETFKVAAAVLAATCCCFLPTGTLAAAAAAAGKAAALLLPAFPDDAATPCASIKLP